MGEAIGIRLPKAVLKQIAKLSEEELEDRSTIIRKLVVMGYKDFMQMKYAEEYKKKKLTITEAAHKAGTTVWEMEYYLIEHGYKSSYSIEDLKREIKLIDK
ncbi:UPF0175 family protein [Candidatus Woesearchaeota archaeon]|nr:UPF0175 family protein [Candidatus Woesearchaeota archaeon]